MKFSVIVPVYNAEKYIIECVSSVLNQTVKNFEIVLVDDGSTDSSGRICDSLKAQYGQIIKVIHQENRGQLLTRCVGAEVSEGDYCVYLDADDLVYKNCLEILSQKLQDFSYPDMIIFNYDRLSASGDRTKQTIPLKPDTVFQEESKKAVYEALTETTMLNTMWNKCIKRECLIGCEEMFIPYSSLRCGEDRLQVMECVTRVRTILCIEDALYCYRLFDGSVTRSFHVSQVDKFNMRGLCEAEEKYLQKWGMDTEENYEKLRAVFLNNATYTFFSFYEKIKDNKQRKELVEYNWQDFVPQSYIEGVESNPYVSSFNKKLWKYITDKNYLKIRLLFSRRISYKKLRDIKRKYLK